MMGEAPFLPAKAQLGWIGWIEKTAAMIAMRLLAAIPL
jgi:hypothetical protein